MNKEQAAVTAEFAVNETKAEELLVASGFEHLVPLLELKKQEELLSALKNGGQEQVADFEARYRSKFPVVKEGIWGIHGVISEATGKIGLTGLGQRLAVFLEKHPECSIVIIRDIAHEIDGKPFEKSRRPKKRAYSPLMAEDLPQPPELDAYIVGNEPISLEQVSRELKGGVYLPRNRVNIVVKSGNRRPYHRYVLVHKIANQSEYGVPRSAPERIERRRKERYPLAHLCFSRNEIGIESRFNNLLVSIMAEDNCPPVLLIPERNETGKVIGFEGRQLNFFSTSGECVYVQNNKGKYYRPGIYFFPGIIFPKENWPEGLDGLMRVAKTAAWNNLWPVINRSDFSGRLSGPDDILDAKRLIELSRQTNHWIVENIVYVLTENPSLLGDKKQRIANARFLLEKFFDALDGDPEFSFLRFRAMGFFDEKGFFPKLGRFLGKDYHEQKLQGRLASCAGGQAGTGRKVFFDFLFEEIEGNNETLVIADLFKPSLYPGNSLRQFIRDCLFWHDERFIPILQEM